VYLSFAIWPDGWRGIMLKQARGKRSIHKWTRASVDI
jgi:hypothetical protein